MVNASMNVYSGVDHFGQLPFIWSELAENLPITQATKTDFNCPQRGDKQKPEKTRISPQERKKLRNGTVFPEGGPEIWDRGLR